MLSPFFPGNKSIKFGTLQKVFGKKTDIKKITIERDWNTKKESVKRQDLESWEQFGYHKERRLTQSDEIEKHDSLTMFQRST